MTGYELDMKLGIFAVFVVVVKKFLSLPESNSCRAAGREVF
jgi:hypothetical protein